jgi:alkaline phosphatase D
LIYRTDLPDGNSKYTTFEVDTRIQNKPVVKVQVTIDGEEAWQWVRF